MSYQQFEIERDKDEILITNDRVWDLIDGEKVIVMSVREARRLVEGLLDQIMTVDPFSDEEDG
tara:strand:- start:2288 stop:2476 length:189 start_codon:yes stop_codon:yes gene_type:complete